MKEADGEAHSLPIMRSYCALCAMKVKSNQETYIFEPKSLYM